MSCVNKASLQFKDCCKRLDLSEQQLEQIVYDYTNQLGNENTFPTDTYIEQLLRGIPTSELSDSQRELYKLKYEETQPLDTFELVQLRVLELQQYYPDDRIKVIQRNNGKYQVVVNTDYSQEETEQEINQIKKEAITNGTFGKVKNKEGQLVDSILFNTLGERTWLQVRTKAFKDWFGDWINDPQNSSKVVDENGEPLPVYHHTDNPNLTEFSIDFENYFSKDGGTKEAIFFDENKTGTLNRKYDIPVFLNIKDLHEYNETKELLHQRGTTYRQVVNESATANNIDGGVHMKDFDDNKMEHQSIWIVHNPNQIKSATDNVGTFSAQSNNIKLQRLPNNTRREYLLDKLKGYYSQQDYVRDLVLRDLGMFLATHRGFSLKKFGTQEIRNFEKTSNIDNEVKLYTQLLRLAYGTAIYEPYVKTHSNGKVTVITTFRTLDNLIDYFYNNRISMFNDLSLLDLESEYNRLVLEDEIQENLNEFNRFYINPKKKDEIYNNLLKKAIIEAEAINTSMEYLESLPNTQEDNAFVADCIRFIKNGSIVNFEMYGLLVREVWDYLRKRHYDISSIRNTVQLFLTYANFTLKSVKDDGETLTREKIEQRFDKFTFSGTAVTTNGEELEIYDVEDSLEGQQQVCQAIADAAPKREDGKPIYGCPWCVATFNYDPKTKKATPTAGAYETYWVHYNQGKRQIAFHNGKPVAFNSSTHQENEWWDFFDGRDNNYSGYSDIKDINVSNRLKRLDLEGNDFLHFRTEGVLMYYRGNTLEEIDVLLNNLLKLGISKAGYSYSNRYSNDLKYKSISGLKFLYNGDYFSYSDESDLEASLDSRNTFGSDKIITTLEITSPKLFSALEAKKLLYAPVIQITSYDNNYFYYIKSGGKDINIKVDSDTADLLKDSYNLLLELKKSADTFNDELTKLILKGVYTTEKDLYDYLSKANYLEKLNKILETLNQAIEQVNKNQEAIDWIKSQVEIEKQRLENKKKREEVISSIRRDRQRREALDLALEYAQENEYSDSDEDLTQLRSDHQNEYDEALKDEENSIQDIDLTLGLGVSKSLAEMYNEGIRKPFNKELSKKLRDILSKYHFEFLDDADMSYFGDNVLGATDMLQKIIYLASENNRNAITEPEEFAHSFITMMGAKYRRLENRDKHPEAKLFSELRDLVDKTSLYQLVYDTYKDVYTYKDGRPNLAAIKEEALGQALAAVLLNREEQYEGDKTFFAKVKRWLQKVIRNIRIQLRRKTKVGEKLISVERALQDELTNIADSILDGSYKKKYLDKLNPKGYNRVDLAQSLQYDREHNNGRIIDFMHTVNDLGGMIDGSLAYRGQGTVYRKAIDTLHDIDITVPLNVHGLLDRFPSIASNSLFAPEQRFWDNNSLENAITQTRFYTELQRRTAQPIHFIAAFTSGEDVIANLMICDDATLVERFKNLAGNYNDRLAKFTEEERQKMYLVDLFFINRSENRIYQDTESNITFSEYTVPFEAKLKMSRAKDLFDYQNFNPAFRHYYGKRDVRMLKLSENQLPIQQPTLEEQQPLEEQPQEPSYEERQLAISEQVSNLINNDRGLKATELRQLSELMVYWMSEFISDCLDNPEKIFQILGITDYSNSDIEKVTLMSRKQIVQMIGVENMFNLCKSYVLTPDIDSTGKGNANINSRALRRQAELLKNNFQGLMLFSTSVWSTLEDFSIGLTETGYNTLEISNPDAFLDEEQIKERDKQADGESTLESWQVESNTIDALTTATQLVKRELLHCYLYENTGEVDDLGKPIKRIKTNKFGINERLNPREAINAIIKWVLGCWDLNSMVAALKEHQDKNPWVEQLVNKLSDINGNESDFQSQFFSCMCRSFQLYGVVNENDKHELYQHSINKNPMLLMAFNGIKDLYKVGEHPLLKLDGIDRKAFKEFYEDIEQLINFSKKKYSEIENIDELNTLISHVYMLLGYYDATPEVVGAAMSDMTFKTLVQNLLTLRTYLDNEKLNKLYNPFDFKANNSIISTLLNVLKPITYIMDDYAVTQFFESGNMRQSNVIPSFMTKLFSKMQLPLKEFGEFVEKEYGQFDWFYDKKLKKYKNEWLSRLVRMPEEERKKLFEHKVQLSFNKKQYMRGMTDSEYAVSVISEYFTAGKQTAWYKVPIMSNKPTSEFIKFIKYDDSDYKDRIVVGMLHIFVLELGRIQTIIKRQNAGINKSDPRFIKNFDKNGAKFCFLDFLNPFLNESKNTELGLLLNIKINGTRELSTEENARLNDLVKQEIRNSMEARVQLIMESWRQQGILTAVSLIQGFERKPEKAEGNWESAANNAKIENFIWNDTFAAMEILLLTITDVAQYKDAEDLQKRLAQIHAPGVRGNILARDYFGNQVSDGTHRAVYLTDFDDFISNVIDNVTKVFDKKIAEAPENEKAQWRALKESLVGEDGAYRQINVADALAYACPTSYRKKAYMFGKWSREKERMYQQLMSGQYDFSTLKQAFGEPLKPFLYSYEEVDAGVENSPIETFKIGVQNKDSEYLLIMADALTRNEDTGIPNILRAIYDVMEESHKVKTNEKGKYIAATDGIDDIQFESTVKAGLYGRINLKQFSTDPQGEANAKNELRSKIFDGLGGYNSTYIHETRYEDYCIQQEVPEHFKDHSQAHGSQIRYIIPSDLPLTNANGETVVYSYFDPATGTERKLDAKQFKAEYENHCATNIQESLDLLKEEFGLVTPDGQISFDRKQMNQTLSEILKREILSSPRYGIDMLLACSLNADGEFNIPLGDPIQSRRIEQLINSIIKNRINKQKIAGGPVVLVTTFGTSRDLNIRFKSNKGGLLMTRKEFEKSKEEGTYEEYIEKYQDGIAYYEIYAPMYTNELFQQFADKDGNIDIKRIEKENPELLKIIGYRIPTEDKYSCFPAKIVGFLPREAGDAVMLPADITAITGSDFDVDKMYLMRKEFKEEKKSKEEITKELEAVLLKGLTGKAKDVTQKQIEDFMNLREGEKESAIRNNISNPIVKAYANMSKKRFVEYTEGRQYHNNMIIDMSYSVLTNKEIAYLVLNPGGFDLQKRMGYAIAAYKDPEVRSKYTFEQLMEMPIDKGEVNLKSLCYKNKNLAFFDTQVQFYKQNSAAGMILGMFAVLKIAHAVLESDGFGIDLGKVFIDKNTNEQIPFGFCGIPFLGIVEVDKRFDANNQLIGKTLGSLVASAADAVKDPVLNLNNINNQTANVLTTMLRLGIVYEDAALLLSQPAITKALLEHSKRMVNKEFISLNALIKARMQELDDKYYMSESEKIQSEPLNREDLIRGFSESDIVEAEKLEWKVLNAYLKFNQMSLIIKGLTNATRYNSVSNAVGPLIIDNLIMEYKAGKFSDAITYKGVESKDINSVFNIHPILDKFSLATIIARRLLGEMPAYSSDFRILVNNSGDYTLSKIMGDRKLFSKLSDFYQSYLLVQSGFINPKDREYYTDKFPVEFMKYKEQYSDNPFVLAIRLSTGTFGGKTKGILTLDSVGMEQMQKDKLSSGWADLYKENPELAKKLFIYNFFKGGLGFSPKTFMNLVPISMKEFIENNGIKYVDVYRHLPSLGNYSMVFDLFVGNNVGDFKLVPQRNPYSEHQNILGNRIIITTKFENYELDYFKVKGFNNIYRIFKLLLVDPVTKRKIFVEIPVLGNQGEFFDVSATPINKSNVTNNILEEEGFEPFDEEIVSEEGYDPYYTKIAIDIIKNEKGLKDTKEAYETLKSSRKTQEGLSLQEAEQRKAKIREAIMNSLKRRNITFNEEELNKTTNEFC